MLTLKLTLQTLPPAVYRTPSYPRGVADIMTLLTLPCLVPCYRTQIHVLWLALWLTLCLLAIVLALSTLPYLLPYVVLSCLLFWKLFWRCLRCRISCPAYRTHVHTRVVAGLVDSSLTIYLSISRPTPPPPPPPGVPPPPPTNHSINHSSFNQCYFNDGPASLTDCKQWARILDREHGL